MLAQCRHRLDEVAAIELVVAGHEEHRHRPAREAHQLLPATVDVTGQHEQLGRGRWCDLDVGFGLEMEIGDELKPHQPAPAAPWHCLNLRPLPQGQGSLRPTFGASRRTASTL